MLTKLAGAAAEHPHSFAHAIVNTSVHTKTTPARVIGATAP